MSLKVVTFISGDLDFIKTTWTSFFEQKAGALFFMTTMKTYDVYEGCAANAIGKRAVVGITTPAVPVPTQCVVCCGWYL